LKKRIPFPLDSVTSEDSLPLEFNLSSFDIIFEKYRWVLDMRKESAKRRYKIEKVEGYHPIGIIHYAILSKWWVTVYERDERETE